MMPRIAIDEMAFKTGHSYITLLYDLNNRTVEAISTGNDVDAAKKTAFPAFQAISSRPSRRSRWCMSAAYVKAAKETIPLAENKIVHGRFHVMQLATKAVDEVQRGEHKKLKSEGDDRPTHSRYLCLKSQENLTDNQRALFDEIYTQQRKKGKAWAYKEMLRDLWQHEESESATTHFNDWYKRVIHTDLAPVKTVARTIKERLVNVASFCSHRIANAVAEGMSNKIMSNARGIGGSRNVRNPQTALFIYRGGLQL